MKNKLIIFVLFFSFATVQAKEENRYVSSTITKACKDAGHSHCKEKATQTKDFIFAFKKAYKMYENIDAKERYEKSWNFASKK